MIESAKPKTTAALAVGDSTTAFLGLAVWGIVHGTAQVSQTRLISVIKKVDLTPFPGIIRKNFQHQFPRRRISCLGLFFEFGFLQRNGFGQAFQRC